MPDPNPETDASQLLPGSDGLSRGRAVKNLVMLGLSFVLMFTSLDGLATIQSSYNSSGGLGTTGLAVTYTTIMVSSLVLGPLVTGRLGPKRTMAAALTGYLIEICANLYPHWATIIPGSVLRGLCGGPLWVSVSVYTVRLADLYVEASGADKKDKDRLRERILSIFFGVFYTIYTSCSVWGNLISFLAFRPSQIPELNATKYGANLSCGYRFCSAASNDKEDGRIQKLAVSQFYVMMGCFIATGVLSILVMLFLVDRTDRDSDKRGFSLTQLRDNLRAMLGQMADPRQLLLVILTVNIGLGQSFGVVDFTEGYLACSGGIATVGRVMMCCGAGQIVSGLVFGQVAGQLGRTPVLIATACVQLTLESLALFWQAAAEPAWLFYAFAFAWGCVDTVLISQMDAVYGDYFADNSNTAYSVFSVLDCLGYVLGFSYNKLLCIEQKLHVMLAVVCTGCVAFLISAVINRRMQAARVA